LTSFGIKGLLPGIKGLLPVLYPHALYLCVTSLW